MHADLEQQKAHAARLQDAFEREIGRLGSRMRYDAADRAASALRVTGAARGSAINARERSREDVCGEARAPLARCLRLNRLRPLDCTPAMDAFRACVTRERTAYVRQLREAQ